MKSTYVSLLFMAFICQINASTIFVKSGSNGTGESWDMALGTLTAALEVAQSGDQIWVATGTYTPSADDRSASFEVKNDVQVYGGFIGNESQLNQRNPILNKTILSGEIGNPGIADNSYTVVYLNGASANTALNGFTITAGNANGEGAEATRSRCGGAIYNNGTQDASKPTITNCIFKQNHGRDGAAIFNNGRQGEASPTFTNCTFLNNTADLDGGAMYNDGKQNGISNPVLKNCTFTENMGTYGGAIFNATETGVCNLYLENCAFNENSAYLRGGAVFNMNGTDKCVTELLDCSFTGNYPDDQSKLYTNNAARSVAYSLTND